MTKPALSASCHCGAVTWSLAERPGKLVRCNCSLCRRVGALWAHAEQAGATFSYDPAKVVKYAYGDKTLTVVSCAVCGNTTHYEGLGEYADRCAVNASMANPAELDGIPVKHFDGAESWEYLD